MFEHYKMVIYQHIVLGTNANFLRRLQHISFSAFANPAGEDVMSNSAKSRGTPLSSAKQLTAFTGEELGFMESCSSLKEDKLQRTVLF